MTSHDTGPRAAARTKTGTVVPGRQQLDEWRRRYGAEADLWVAGAVVAGVLVAVAKVLWWLVRFAARFPIVAGVVGLLGLAYWEFGNVAAAVGCGLLVVVLVGWRLVDEAGWDRVVAWRVRASWRSWAVYGRRWETVTALVGLNRQYEAYRLVPKLHHVASTPGRDRVTVQLVEGQHPDDFLAQAGRLAHAFGATSCRARTVRNRQGQAVPGVVWLDFHYGDPLADVVPTAPLPDKEDG